MNWTLQTIPVEKLIEWKRNPRKITPEDFEELKKSFAEFAQARTLTVSPMKNGKFEIIGGNQSKKALKELGITEIQCSVAEKELTEQEKEKLSIQLNHRNKGEGMWDFQILDEFTIDLGELGIDMPEIGEQLEAKEDDYQIPDEIKTDIVLGDLIEIGRHRLLCGDSTDSDQVAKLMDGEKADMVFTDPPYNADYKSRGEDELLRKGIKNDNMSDSDFENFIKGFISTTLLNIKDGASLYFCCNWKDSYKILDTNLSNAGINISANIVWNKGSAGMGWQDYRYQYEFIIYGFKKGAKHNWFGGRTETDIWEFSRDTRTEYKHPTQKPVALPSKAIKNSSKDGDLIMELFTGSGPTMVAAHQLNRKCYGMELDEKYCQVIIDRMLKLDPTLEVKINGQPYNK